MRRRGIGSFCHGDASTSTVHHQLHSNKEQLMGLSSSGVADAASSSFLTVPASVAGSCVAESELSGGCGGPLDHHHPAAAVTLEQMILQLDLEEAAARRRVKAAAAEDDDGWCPRRMSCVDAGSSAAAADHVLRSARDALSQYPRFSLDGRDAMYRASFYDDEDGTGLGLGAAVHRPTSAGSYEMDLERTLRMPATVAGESVVWCKPGVVAKLMGLDAVPVPVRGRRRKASGGAPLAATTTTCAGGGGVRKQQRLLARRTAGQEDLAAFHKERLFMALHGYDVVGAGAGAAACHAGGAHRSAVGPQAAGGVGSRHGGGWQFGLRR
ncbi:hypothetical protein QOZ80_1BG0053360 [Eleusine coracana subsp. coracana]|nr:hypothetical protein QOZ80_1BG0053360 [Eleusine coracana subsp. coracana]